MKVLIAVHGFPPTYFAGCERAAERVALWLVERGHQAHVFTLERVDDPDTRLETNTENGIVVHRLFIDVKDGDHYRNLYDDSRIGDHLRRLLDGGGYDVVHVVGGFFLGGQVIRTAKQMGLPVVLTLTEFWYMCSRLNLLTANGEMCVGPDTDAKCARCALEEKRRFRLPAAKVPAVADAFWAIAQHAPFAQAQEREVGSRRETLKAAVAAADAVICPSHFLMSKFTEYGFDMRRAEYLLYGIRHPNEADLRRRQPRTPGTLRLGYVGQIKAHKGVHLITDAVMPLLDAGAAVTVELWGSGSGAPEYAEQLKAATRAYAGISWPGSYASDQLWQVLGRFDALIVPSRWYENSPTVILEAFAMGIPVVATNLGSMPELVKHDVCGLVFERDDAQDLRRQIQRLLGETGLLERLTAGIGPVPTIEDEVSSIFRRYELLT